MKQFLAEILHNEPIAKDYLKLTFSWPEQTTLPLPGQFLNIRCSEATSPLLRRPFAFSGFEPVQRAASIIYEVRGLGTEILATKHTGDSLDVIAPLGNSFIMSQGRREGIGAMDGLEPTASRGRQQEGGAVDGLEQDASAKDSLHVLISGGIGLGPIRFLACFFREKGIRFIFIHGAREANFLPKESVTEGLNTVFCTDDGSSGFHGKTTDYLESIEKRFTPNTSIFACGPLPMLKACHLFAEGRGLDCLVSMEQIMGCGFSACMGCVIKTTNGNGFARVCEEGPVFSSRSVLWT